VTICSHAPWSGLVSWSSWPLSENSCRLCRLCDIVTTGFRQCFEAKTENKSLQCHPIEVYTQSASLLTHNALVNSMPVCGCCGTCSTHNMCWYCDLQLCRVCAASLAIHPASHRLMRACMSCTRDLIELRGTVDALVSFEFGFPAIVLWRTSPVASGHILEWKTSETYDARSDSYASDSEESGDHLYTDMTRSESSPSSQGSFHADDGDDHMDDDDDDTTTAKDGTAGRGSTSSATTAAPMAQAP
jgi:hypothetical protein